MRASRRTSALLLALMLVSPGAVLAQSEQELANPIADLISVRFQSNFDFGGGPHDDAFRYTLNVQPVVPISLTEDCNCSGGAGHSVTYTVGSNAQNPLQSGGGTTAGATPPASVNSELGPLAVGGDADDPAIWIHPNDRSKSLLFLSDKDSGIYVYDLAGALVQHVDFGTALNNIDARTGFRFGGQTIDIVAGNLRDAGQLAVLKINPDWTSGNAVSVLSDASGSGNAISADSYGFTLYQHFDGTMYVFDKPKSGAPIVQWEMDGSSGSIRTTQVRSLSGLGVSEGFVADDHHGFVYFAQESGGIHKYQASPGAPTTKVAQFASGHGETPDLEGLALYACADGSGYLVLSSQGDSTFKVYQRQSNAYVGTFRAVGSSGTDGLDVTAFSVPQFPDGFAVIHDDPSMTYRVYDWADIAGGSNGGLMVCPR